MLDIPLIMQRSDTDCSICCTAMALRLTYNTVLAAAGDGLGWDGLRFDSVFEGFGYDVVFQPRLFQPRLPAIFSVPSKLNAGRFHAVYYEGGRIADPTAKTTPYVLSEVLTNMQGVYQWEFVGGALHA